MIKQLSNSQAIIIGLQAIAVTIVSLNIFVQAPTKTISLTIQSFPKINLVKWQSLTTKSLISAELKPVIKGELQGGEEQVFQQQQQTLILRRAYISQTDGDLKNFIKEYNSDLFSTLNYQAEIGHYSQFFVGDRLTMMACLAENGKATVTADQFKVEQLKTAFSLKQFSGWLRNRHSLIPQTCQWRSLSIFPVETNSPETLVNLWQTLNQD